MALNDPPKTPGTGDDVCGSECGSGYSKAEEEELEKLELDLRQMAQKILEYRATLPDQLKNTFASILSAQRPVFPCTESGFEPGPSGKHSPASNSIFNGLLSEMTCY